MSKKRKYISKKIRDSVLKMFDGACAYCGDSDKPLELDHIEPVASSRCKEDESNYLPACKICNRFKAAMTLEQFRSEILSQNERLFRYSVNARMARRYGMIRETGVKEVVFYFEAIKRKRAEIKKEVEG